MRRNEALSILNLSGDPSKEEIEATYRKRLQLLNPIRFQDDEALLVEVRQQISATTIAYTVLMETNRAASTGASDKTAGDALDEKHDPQHESEAQSVTVDESNIWTSILLRPRATIQYVVDTDPTRHVLLFAGLGGIMRTINMSSIYGWGDYYPYLTILMGAFVFGPMIGIFSLYFSTEIYRWTGRFLGGEASSERIRAALSWAKLPVLYVAPLGLLSVFVFGQEHFSSEGATPDGPFEFVFILILSASYLCMGVWNMVVWLKCYAQVQGFSVAKAMLNLVLYTLVFALGIFTPIFVLWIFFGAVTEENTQVVVAIYRFVSIGLPFLLSLYAARTRSVGLLMTAIGLSCCGSPVCAWLLMVLFVPWIWYRSSSPTSITAQDEWEKDPEVHKS